MEFEKRNMRIASLEEELRSELERCGRLELACGKLSSELRREKARPEKFASMLFGLNIKSGMVFNGLEKIWFDFLKPLYELLLSDLRLEGRWHADETRWRIFLDEYGKLWYMWAFRSEKIVAFVLDPTRAASVPLKTLFGLSIGDAEKMRLGEVPVALAEADMKKLNVDRYSAYKVLAKYGLALLSYCWAHVRRAR